MQRNQKRDYNNPVPKIISCIDTISKKRLIGIKTNEYIVMKNQSRIYSSHFSRNQCLEPGNCIYQHVHFFFCII
jgi:hypothetical protein